MGYEVNDQFIDQIFQEGYRLLKQKGMRKMSILDITRAVDIATGTFYHYFQTKEDFVYQMVLYFRKDVTRQFTALLKDGHMDRSVFRSFLLGLNDSYRDVFSLLSPIEQQRLIERYPLSRSNIDSDDLSLSRRLLSYLSGVQENCNWQVLSNLLSSLSLFFIHRDAMYAEQFLPSVEILVDAILTYIFGALVV